MKRYSRRDIVARYVEAEWGDVLLKHAEVARPAAPLFEFGGRTASFYQEVVALLAREVSAPLRILDVGSATGRLVRELGVAFPGAEEIVGCEPSPELHELSLSMLAKKPRLQWLPIVNRPCGRPEYVRPDELFWQATALSCDARKIDLVCSRVEDVPRPDEYFDMVCCLNVVDRHENPRSLMRGLFRLVAVGGVLCVASPLDWRGGEAGEEEWEDDLRCLLDVGGCHFSVAAESNLEYVFRVNERKSVRFLSQVLVLEKSGGDGVRG